MAGMGSADPGSKINKRKYQSNENNTELGLNWMDFHNRQYDAQLGRFLSVDPLASSTDYQSPYAGMDNNPVSVVDPLGLKGISNSSWVDYNPTKQDWDLMGSLTSYLDGISGVPGVDPIASANRTLMEGASVREEQRETDRVMGQYFSILGEVYGNTDGGAQEVLFILLVLHLEQLIMSLQEIVGVTILTMTMFVLKLRRRK